MARKVRSWQKGSFSSPVTSTGGKKVTSGNGSTVMSRSFAKPKPQPKAKVSKAKATRSPKANSLPRGPSVMSEGTKQPKANNTFSITYPESAKPKTPSRTAPTKPNKGIFNMPDLFNPPADRRKPMSSPGLESGRDAIIRKRQKHLR